MKFSKRVNEVLKNNNPKTPYIYSRVSLPLRQSWFWMSQDLSLGVNTTGRECMCGSRLVLWVVMGCEAFVWSHLSGLFWWWCEQERNFCTVQCWSEALGRVCLSHSVSVTSVSVSVFLCLCLSQCLSVSLSICLSLSLSLTPPILPFPVQFHRFSF